MLGTYGHEKKIRDSVRKTTEIGLTFQVKKSEIKMMNLHQSDV